MSIQPATFSRDVSQHKADNKRWPARLELCYARKADRTVVNRRHHGPLLIQRPFYPESDGTCHNYVLHPPGGVAGGDSLELEITVEPVARCLLTAPGATKVYRTIGEGSRQSVNIDVSPGAVCEFLPMELILFDGAQFRSATEIRLHGNGVFFGWDIVSLGRPASGESFNKGFYEQRTAIMRDGQPIWFERSRIDGGSQILDASHGFNGYPIYGTAIYSGPLPDNAIDILRDQTPPAEDGFGSFSRLGDIIVCRFIGSKVSAGRKFFVGAWSMLRKIGLNKSATAPRIWAT